jgi:hypothetical protein
MSLVHQLNQRVRTAADGLPVEPLRDAVARLHRASHALGWAGQAMPAAGGLPRLGAAIDHAEQAAGALRTAQDALADYLVAALGIPTTGPVPAVAAGPPPREWTEPAPAVGWWPARVDSLTGYEPEPVDATTAGDGAEVLRRVAAHVRGADSDGLRRELRVLEPSAGLRLGLLAAPLIHEGGARLLGHRPGPADQARLRRATEAAVRANLPGLPDAALAALLARACRAPVHPEGAGSLDASRPRPGTFAAHPVDLAVGGAVLAAVLAPS